MPGLMCRVLGPGAVPGLMCHVQGPGAVPGLSEKYVLTGYHLLDECKLPRHRDRKWMEVRPLEELWLMKTVFYGSACTTTIDKVDWSNCSHILLCFMCYRCAFQNTPKYSQVLGKGRIVKKTWIMDCYAQKKLLPWRQSVLSVTAD